MKPKKIFWCTQPKKKKNAASGMNNETMNLISGLTVLRFTSMLGMRNVYFTKEELLKLNKQQPSKLFK